MQLARSHIVWSPTDQDGMRRPKGPEHRLPEAIEKFKESHRLSKNPVLLYNIGLVMEESDMGDLALMYYRRFLKEAPDTAPSPQPGNAVFDSPDFDKHLQAETDTAAAAADLLPDADQSPHPDLPEMAAPPQRGLFLTPAMLAILAVVLLILLATTFVAGFYVARATAPVAIVNS